MYIYIYTYIYIYIYIYIYTHAHTHIYVVLFMCTFLCLVWEWVAGCSFGREDAPQEHDNDAPVHSPPSKKNNQKKKFEPQAADAFC